MIRRVSGPLIRRAPPLIVGSVHKSTGIPVGNGGIVVALVGARWPGIIRSIWVVRHDSVCEEAAFDGPYNIALEPAPRRAALAPRLLPGVS